MASLLRSPARALPLLGVALVSAALACGANDETPGYSSAGSSGVGAAGSGGAGATGASGGTSAGGGSGGFGAVGGGPGGGGLGGTGAGPACAPMPKCDAPLPDVGPARAWVSVTSAAIAATGFANHRGRDMILNPTSPQWIIGKFAYGVIDKDIKGEEVDIWLERDCAGAWEKLGTELTTQDGQHATVEGVEDSGGRIYFELPAGKQLGIGRHRVLLVVAGDLSTAPVLIEVVPNGTAYFATDVDGTLTTVETEEYGAILTGTVSDANPDAASALSLLAEKGYRPYYLTARPEFLVGRTREFVEVKGFPLGPVHTTLALGATGAAATSFKLAELQELQGRGMTVAWAFGNKDSDADCFFQAGIEPADHRILFQYTDTAHGGRRIDAYSELLGELGSLAPICP